MIFVMFLSSLNCELDPIQMSTDISMVPNEAYREIFQSMSEGIIMVDELGKITIANPVAEQLFGYEQNELNGKMLENLLPERLRKGHIRFRDTFYSDQIGRAHV